jgi:hypothetical protein
VPYLSIAPAVGQAFSDSICDIDSSDKAIITSSSSSLLSSTSVNDMSLPYREINYEDLNFTSSVPIGRGAFGVVFKAEWRGATVAVKKLSMFVDDEQIAQLRSECMLMYRCGHHPNVIRFIG